MAVNLVYLLILVIFPCSCIRMRIQESQINAYPYGSGSEKLVRLYSKVMLSLYIIVVKTSYPFTMISRKITGYLFFAARWIALPYFFPPCSALLGAWVTGGGALCWPWRRCSPPWCTAQSPPSWASSCSPSHSSTSFSGKPPWFTVQ